MYIDFENLQNKLYASLITWWVSPSVSQSSTAIKQEKYKAGRQKDG